MLPTAPRAVPALGDAVALFLHNKTLQTGITCSLPCLHFPISLPSGVRLGQRVPGQPAAACATASSVTIHSSSIVRLQLKK